MIPESKAQAVAFAWDVAAPIAMWLGFIAVILTGLAVVKEITR